MMRRTAALAILAVSSWLTPQHVLADDISYTYVDAHIQGVDPDIGDADLGYRFEGSLGLLLGFYGFASWESADLDRAGGDFEAADLGLGWHLGIGDTLHALAELSYSNRQVGVFDEDGYTFNVGVRFAPGDRWEFGAKAGYRELENNLAGGYGEAYALWKIWGVLGLSARAELAEEGNRLGIGARVSF